MKAFVAAAKATKPGPHSPVHVAPYDWEEAGTRQLMTGGHVGWRYGYAFALRERHTQVRRFPASDEFLTSQLKARC